MFLPLAIKVLDAFTNMPTFFINVQTWDGQQRALHAFLYWCCIIFINIKCWWHYRKRFYFEMNCYYKERFFWAWSFIEFTSPFICWYVSCDKWRVQFLVVVFPQGGPPLNLGYLFAWTLVLALCLFIFSFSWVHFVFIKFGKVSSHFKIWITRMRQLEKIKGSLKKFQFSHILK